jgi:hypothetical protein
MIPSVPDDIHLKVVRTSMAVRLKSRGPLPDYRAAERAWCISASLKFRDAQACWRGAQTR